MKKTYGSYKDYSYVYENKLIVFLAAYNYYHPDVQISLDDVKDFLSFEFDESGKPRAFSRPDNIADYIAWFWSDDGNNQVSNYEVGLWIYMDRFSNEYQDAKIDEMDTEEMYKLIEDYNSFLSQG